MSMVTRLEKGSCPECCEENILVVKPDGELPFCICADCDLDADVKVFEDEFAKYAFMDAEMVGV